MNKVMLAAILLVGAVLVAAFGWKAFKGATDWAARLCAIVVGVFFSLALVLMSYQVFVSPLP